MEQEWGAAKKRALTWWFLSWSLLAAYAVLALSDMHEVGPRQKVAFGFLVLFVVVNSYTAHLFSRAKKMRIARLPT